MNTSSCYLGITVSVGAYIYVALAKMHQILLEFVQNPFHWPKALSSSSRRLDIHFKGYFTIKHLLNEDKMYCLFKVIIQKLYIFNCIASLKLCQG